jgi:hypothetical protein
MVTNISLLTEFFASGVELRQNYSGVCREA